MLEPVQHLVLVHRLREVASLLGFTRFEAVSPNVDGELDLEVERASLAETITWLPAIENRGEGVFVSFKPEAVKAWLARPEVQVQEDSIKAGWRSWVLERNWAPDQFPGVAYIMLHSLAHMLITAISMDCGYPAGSLRERVYCTESGYGILIYTGSADSEGTLGGLVEGGRRMSRISETSVQRPPAVFQRSRVLRTCSK